MWGLGFPIERMETTTVSQRRFSVWTYSDPSTSKLTLHLALYSTELFSEKRTGYVSYSTWGLEPYNSQALRYFGSGALVKRFDFDLSDPALKEVLSQASNKAMPHLFALNSNVLGIAFIEVPGS